MDQAAQQKSPIAVYWQPGCTSCLRTKEFLTKNGVKFESRNVLTDTDAFNDLAKLGLRQIPIVTLNGQWADGQVLADVAKLVGIRHGRAPMIAPADLLGRARRVQSGASRFLAQVPGDKLYTMQPSRPRSYADLAYHIFSLADAFLEHDRGIPLTFDAYNRYTTPGNDSREQILAYGNSVLAQWDDWVAAKAADVDWSAPADVYYGKQTMHEFLERTTWHSGQHLRQLMWGLEQWGIKPDQPVGDETFRGLPMPMQIWEDADIAAV